LKGLQVTTLTQSVAYHQPISIEVESTLSTVINTDLEKADLSQHTLFVTAHLKNHLLKNVDYMAYGMSDELELPALDVRSCDAAFAYHDPKVRIVLIGVLKDLFSVSIIASVRNIEMQAFWWILNNSLLLKS